MNQNYPQGAVPQPNPSYPMARLNGSAYAAPLNYNQPSEVVGGYDAKINPMTGQEIPDVNFAGGGRVGSEAGIASLLASRGRGGDSMLVHMNPEEVKGLQALALAHGGSLTINPDTGLVEALSLKSILPQIAGAVLNRFAPDAGKAVGSLLGFKDAAASNIGAGLIVGGITGLVEGDLKKGLEAGLGAYSGSVISSGLSAAQAAAERAKVQTDAPLVPPLSSFMKSESALTGQPTISSIGGGMGGALGTPAPAPAAASTLPEVFKPSFIGGLRGLLTPEGREAFGKNLGGGFESDLGQSLSRAAVFTGAAMPFAEQPKAFPGMGSGEGELLYIPGPYDPTQSTVFQSQGRYYKRNAQGQLVPYNPWTLAPRGRGFADGGVVGADPNVVATRSYIEELNRRAKAGLGGLDTASATTTGGLGTFGPQYLPPPTAGGDAGVGGAGGGGAPGVGSIIGGLAGQYLVNKGIDTGLDYLGEKLGLKQPAATADSAAQSTAPTTTSVLDADLANLSKFTPDVSSLSSIASNVPGLAPYGQLGGLESTGLGALQPTTLADAANMTNLSSAYAPSGSVASQFGGMRGALDAGPNVTDAAAEASRLGINYGVDTPAAAQRAADIVNAAKSTALDLSGVLTPADLVNSPYAALDPSLYQAPATVTQPLAGAETGLGSLQGKIIPGLQTALGLHQAYQGISKGNEAQAALGAYGASSGLGSLMGFAGAGPVGLAAAAIAAIGASMVNTKEFGDVALRNYWNAVDQGRGFGSAPPEELAQGFINFYRTNKNQFAGQEKYGRTGNEDFVYDMTQVINDAVKSGKVGKDVDAATMYKEVVQPWLNDMGPGPQDADARRIQDFMMTDLIHNFMQGKPISNAQVKGDTNFKIVSQKPVYAGAAAAQEAPAQPEIQNMPAAVNAIRQAMEARSPYATPVEDVVRAMPMPEQEVISPYAPVQEFVGTPYMPEVPMVPISREEPVFVPRGEDIPVASLDGLPEDLMRGVSLGDDRAFDRVFVPREEAVPIAPEAPVSYDYNPFEGYNYNPFEDFNMYSYAGGGAIGEGYNFGFAHGGRPGEYRAGGKYLQGPGDGMSDDIKANIDGQQEARLADGEFVIPADVVSHLGNGSSNAGAKKLHQMMARVRQARTGKKKQAPAVKVDRYIPA